MTTCNCSCAAEAWKAGYEAGTASLPPASPEHAQRVAALLAPWLEQLATPRGNLVTVAQAAGQLGISERTVYELMSTGELASIKLRPGQIGPRRIEQAEISRFIERNRVARASS